MTEAFLGLLVLGQIPGTNTVIDYNASVIIGACIFMIIATYATFRYRFYVARKLRYYTPEKLIELKTL